MRKEILILILICLFLISSCQRPSNGKIVKNTKEVKEFTIRAYQFGFEPNVITVKKGDVVKITAYSSDVPHGLAIPEFGVSLYLDGLTSKTVVFVADKAGTFTFFCNVPCGYGHGGMNGKLIVK